MSTGTVRSFDSAKGCGFLWPDDGSRDVSVPASAVDQARMKALQAGQKLSSIPRGLTRTPAST
jgi:CspA family cold shock protein